MKQEQQYKFEKWIKIRIGEPITAIDITKDQCIFGSISGYIGFYNIGCSELNYMQFVFEEIIRGIHIQSNIKTYITIGDFYGILMNSMTKEWSEVKYDKRTHNQTLCSSSLALMYKNSVVLMTVAPTQNKDLGLPDISIKKNNLYVVDLDNKEMTHYHVQMPPLYVPFDYDGQNLLLLEYMPGAKKRMHRYDFNKRQLEVIYQVPHKVEFISYGKILNNLLIFVENHHAVKVYDTETKKEEKLFDMPNQIVALDVLDVTDLVNQSVKIASDEESKSHIEIFKKQIINLLSLQIAVVDYNSNFKLWLNGKIIIPQVPSELIKHKYIFDMGYPYYLKVNQGRLAITNDLGILIITI